MAKTEERDRRDRDDEDDDDKKAKAPAKGGGKKVLLIASGAMLLLVASILGTFLITRMLAGGHAASSAATGTAPVQPAPKPKLAPTQPRNTKQELYLALDPPFVVNFQGQNAMHFLQVTIEVMAHEPAAIKDVKEYMPHIRNNLVMLLSNQSSADLSTLAGKEKVRTEALAEIQKILQQETGSPQVYAVYFTSFVMQ